MDTQNAATGDGQTERACPLCGAAKPEQSRLFESDGWTVVQCKVCAMVFLENPPSYEAVAQDFAWDQSRDRESVQRREREPWLHAVQHVLRPIRDAFRKDKVSALMRRYCQDGEFIDIGCGTGKRLERRLPDVPRNIRPFGIEIEPVAAAAAAERFRKLGGDAICQPAIEGMR
ncbi:MAG: hypothetical protein WD079_04745, partial [Phycisphaeraceae bacterium]